MTRARLCAVMAAGSLVVSGGCHQQQTPPPALLPMPATPVSEAPAPTPTRVDTFVARLPEKMITLTGDWDVRMALEEIARTAGYSLIISPRIQPKKARLSLINVPSSQALVAVLDAGQLTLEAAHGTTIPWNPSVVFYQVPVNVDSLSVDVIMKRYGVSRDIANLIVQSRVKP